MLKKEHPCLPISQSSMCTQQPIKALGFWFYILRTNQNLLHAVVPGLALSCFQTTDRTPLTPLQLANLDREKEKKGQKSHLLDIRRNIFVQFSSDITYESCSQVGVVCKSVGRRSCDNSSFIFVIRQLQFCYVASLSFQNHSFCRSVGDDDL